MLMNSNRRTNDPESCLSRIELELLEQLRNWAQVKLFTVNKLCESYPQDVRPAREREHLIALVTAINKLVYLYAL